MKQIRWYENFLVSNKDQTFCSHLFSSLLLQVVPNTRSRSQMGETTDGGLYEIFQQDYGPVGSTTFETARENFLISSAGYAVASLLLQPKDRHNGNLLFDEYVSYFCTFPLFFDSFHLVHWKKVYQNLSMEKYSVGNFMEVTQLYYHVLC